MLGQTKKIIGKIVVYTVVSILLVITLVPIYWTIVTSFKLPGEITTRVPTFIPKVATFVNYRAVFFPKSVSVSEVRGVPLEERSSITGWLGIGNSLIVAICATILSVAIGLLAAYAFTKLRFKGRDSLAFWLLSTRMFPPVTTILPIFLMMNKFHLIDTKVCLIIAYLVFNLPFAVWMLRGFFIDIPNELNESALVDGCGHLEALIKILIPLILPGVIVTAIYCFVFSWNEFLFALILTRVKAQTFPVQISSFIGVKGIAYGAISAFGIVGSFPSLLLAVFSQKYLIRGLTYGAVKR